MMTDIEKADAISRQRAQYLPFLPLVLLSHQGLFFSWEWRAVSLVQTVTWAVLVLAMLFALMTGGNWFTSRKVRELMNDEVTQANRAKAIERGFIGAVLTAMLVFAIAPIEPITGQRAAHLIVSIGLAIALAVFGLEERKVVD